VDGVEEVEEVEGEEVEEVEGAEEVEEEVLLIEAVKKNLKTYSEVCMKTKKQNPPLLLSNPSDLLLSLPLLNPNLSDFSLNPLTLLHLYFHIPCRCIN
jgi:hypothetical protein